MPLASSATENVEIVDPAAAAVTDVGQVDAKDAKPDASAPPSGAENDNGAKQPTSILDAVRGALEPEKPADASPAAKTEGDPAPGEGEAKAEATEGAEEQPPFHTHPAWQKQLAKVRERDTQIAALRPQAEAFTQVQTMMRDNGLTVEEVNTGFNIMSLIRSDPAKAYDALKPYMSALEKVIGVAIPEDLQARVDHGFITEDDAKRESRTRGEAATIRQQQERTETQRAQDSEAAVSRQMGGEISKWETAWQSSDPDYSKKSKLVEGEIHRLRAAHGNPKNVAQALQLVNLARDNVNSQVKLWAPQKQPVKPPVTGGSSVKVVAQPKSVLEVVRMAAGQAA